MKRIGVEGVSLTEYEMNIASQLVDPQTMKVTLNSFSDNRIILCEVNRGLLLNRLFMQVTWRDIAGLDEIIHELQDTVILPFQKRHLLNGSKLFQPPKGASSLFA